MFRRRTVVPILLALLAAPVAGQAANTGGAGWSVSVYTVSSGTSTPFYPAFNPNGGEPGVWQPSGRDEALAVASEDPYARADLFESVEIRPWNWSYKNPTYTA